MKARAPLHLSDGGAPSLPRETQHSRCTNSTYRPGRSARSTALRWAGRGGGDPRACRGHSREGAGGESLRRGQAARGAPCLRELSPRGWSRALSFQHQRRGPRHGPSPASAPRDLRSAGLQNRSPEGGRRPSCARPRSPGRGSQGRRPPRPRHPCERGCRRCR